jgi:nucleotide-binding universal stress UspA family protein
VVRILFPVSRNGHSEDALRLALDTARSADAEIRALFIVDVAGIRRSEAGAPPGTVHMGREAEERIVERETAGGVEAVARIDRACREAGLRFSGEVKKGDPREVIEKEAARCDLLVAEMASRFHYHSEDPCRVALSLMKHRITPVLLAVSPYRPVRAVAIGCGGGDRTVRTVGTMARLGLWKADARIVLLAVDETRRGGEARLAEPRQILLDAGYPPPEEAIVPGPKVEAACAFLEERGIDAAVLGGFGDRRWNDLFGLSITGRLLHLGRYHLFLFM